MYYDFPTLAEALRFVELHPGARVVSYLHGVYHVFVPKEIPNARNQ
jgi:hypothetical protein